LATHCGELALATPGESVVKTKSGYRTVVVACDTFIVTGTSVAPASR